MDKENKEYCKECGSELKQVVEMPKGVLVCYECRKIGKIISAIKDVSSKLEIIIARSQGDNL